MEKYESVSPGWGCAKKRTMLASCAGVAGFLDRPSDNGGDDIKLKVLKGFEVEAADLKHHAPVKFSRRT